MGSAPQNGLPKTPNIWSASSPAPQPQDGHITTPPLLTIQNPFSGSTSTSITETPTPLCGWPFSPPCWKHDPALNNRCWTCNPPLERDSVHNHFPVKRKDPSPHGAFLRAARSETLVFVKFMVVYINIICFNQKSRKNIRKIEYDRYFVFFEVAKYWLLK